MPQRSIWYSLFYQKCPRCREGDLWRSSLLPRFRVYDMYETCPSCKVYYESEPQVWYGAMIVAYIVSSFFLLLTAYIAFGILDLPSAQGYALILFVAVLGFMLNARLSRTLWIHYMIAYQPDILAQQAAIRQRLAAGAQVLDVRPRKEFQAERYEGSTNIPLYELTDRLSELSPDQHYIVVSKTGNRATQAIDILHQHQYTNISNGGTWLALSE